MQVTNESGGMVDLEASLDLATTNATTTISSAISIGKWHHVAMAYTDDGDDEIFIYVDGKLVGTSSNGVGSPTAGDTNNLVKSRQAILFITLLRWEMYMNSPLKG